MEIRQSSLSSYSRCPQQKRLYDLADQGLVKRPGNLSRTVYGTVVHHALQTLERMHHEGDPTALEAALATFAHYWMPENLPELEPHGIDEWLPRDTYGGMRNKGLQVIRDYAEWLRTDDGVLLGLEVSFRVPIDLEEVGQHTIVGTLDRLAIRKYRAKPFLAIEDHKTGKQPTYLRYSVQWTMYSFAIRHREFWEPWGDQQDERWQTYLQWPHRGTWVDHRLGKRVDAGWRGEQDYARLKVALKEYVKAIQADVYPLNMSGDTCLYCSFRDGTCGGVPIPDEDEGKP